MKASSDDEIGCVFTWKVSSRYPLVASSISLHADFRFCSGTKESTTRTSEGIDSVLGISRTSTYLTCRNGIDRPLTAEISGQSVA